MPPVRMVDDPDSRDSDDQGGFDTGGSGDGDGGGGGGGGGLIGLLVITAHNPVVATIVEIDKK